MSVKHSYRGIQYNTGNIRMELMGTIYLEMLFLNPNPREPTQEAMERQRLVKNQVETGEEKRNPNKTRRLATWHRKKAKVKRETSNSRRSRKEAQLYHLTCATLIQIP